MIRGLATAVMVSDLPRRFAMDDLLALMGTMGEIVKWQRIRDGDDIVIAYAEPVGATKAKRKLNGRLFAGVTICVDIYRHPL